MKNLLSIFSLLVMVVLFTACKDDEPVSAEQAFLNKLAGTWTVGSNGVFVDGTDISDQYTSFSITFNSDPTFKVFEVENGGEAFTQQTDSYEFMNADFSMITRNSDEIEMALEMMNDQSLKISFSKLPENTGGRYDGTFGEFVFDLTKN